MGLDMNMIVFTKENFLVRATPYPEIVEIGVGGQSFSLEVWNTGSKSLSAATLKVQYHPKGAWWASSLTGSLLTHGEGSALATLASGAKGVAVLDVKGIYALQLTFTCSGDWNTSYPKDETYLHLYGIHS